MSLPMYITSHYLCTQSINPKKYKDNGNKEIAFRDASTPCRTRTTRPATDARAVPIYQTTSYVFATLPMPPHASVCKIRGNIYGRLTNSTQGVFRSTCSCFRRWCCRIGGCFGAAAVTYALENITRAGDHIVSAKNHLWGGTYNLLEHTLPAYGVTTTFVDPG